VERSLFSTVGRRDVVSDAGITGRTDVVAGDGGFLGLFKMRLAKGRGFTEDENRAHAKVCIVGHKLAMNHWNGDGVGRWLSVGPVRCHVIGQLADQDRWGINFGFDWADVAVLPYETYADVDPAARMGVEILAK